MMAALFVTTFWLHAATLTVTACVLMLRARKLERKSMEYLLLSNKIICYSIAPRIPPGRVLRGEICGTCLPGDVLRGSPRVCACACVCTCAYVCVRVCACACVCMCVYELRTMLLTAAHSCHQDQNRIQWHDNSTRCVFLRISDDMVLKGSNNNRNHNHNNNNSKAQPADCKPQIWPPGNRTMENVSFGVNSACTLPGSEQGKENLTQRSSEAFAALSLCVKSDTSVRQRFATAFSPVSPAFSLNSD